jgi:hypothetical protein
VYAFPAVVPDVEVARSEVVAARLARKVAPLFGVVWDQTPFGRTWVCDFAALTLAEIARGAPYPSRAEQARLDGERPAGVAPDPWRWVGRAVWTRARAPTPAALANATMNKYGPDTKSAVVLTGANRLLEEATAAVAGVCRHLARTTCDAQAKLAIWAGLVLEVYRAQPALVVAAVQTRTIQRSLTSRWGDHLGRDGVGEGGARCEVTARPGPGAGVGTDETSADGGEADSQHRPVSFDLVDATLPLLRLAPPDDATSAVQSVDHAFTADTLDDIAAGWCRRLLQLGRPGRGLVWLVEDDAGHRTVRCYLRVGAIVAPFVAEVLGERLPTAEPDVPAPPPPEDLAGLSVLERRAHVLAVHVVVNYLRYRDELLQSWPQLRPRTRSRVAEASRAAGACLGSADPATLLLTGYEHYLMLWDLLREGATDLAAITSAATSLVAVAGEIAAMWRAGRLDPGAATYLLEIANVALDQAGTALGRPPAIERALHRHWRDALAARGLDPDRSLRDDLLALSPAQHFHLHNYAAYLAGRGGRDELRRALAIQEVVARVRDEVARAEPVSYAAKHTSARTGHEVAARIATALLAVLPARGRTARAEVRATGLHHARAVFDNPTTRRLLLRPDADIAVVSAARSALPPVVQALQDHPPDVDEQTVRQAGELLDAALAYCRRNPTPATSQHAADLADLADLADRLARAIPTGRRPRPGKRGREQHVG